MLILLLQLLLNYSSNFLMPLLQFLLLMLMLLQLQLLLNRSNCCRCFSSSWCSLQCCCSSSF